MVRMSEGSLKEGAVCVCIISVSRSEVALTINRVSSLVNLFSGCDVFATLVLSARSNTNINISLQFVGAQVQWPNAMLRLPCPSAKCLIFHLT